jgi:hypothetical protein
MENDKFPFIDKKHWQNSKWMKFKGLDLWNVLP